MDCWGVRVLVFRSPLLYLTVAPKCRNRDAGHSDTPRGSRKALPDARLRKGQHRVLRSPRFPVTTNLLSVKSWRREKKFMLVLLSQLRLQTPLITKASCHVPKKSEYRPRERATPRARGCCHSRSVTSSHCYSLTVLIYKLNWIVGACAQEEPSPHSARY